MRTVASSKRLFGPAFLAALLCCVAAGHEFWLDASGFRAKPGDVIRIRTMVGDGFPGESRPRDPTKLERFEIAGIDEPIALVGRDGAEPAGMVRLPKAGTYVVGYRSRPTGLVLAGPKFELYLKDKGLDNALEARHAAGAMETDGRERFSRCAKAVISVGDDRGSGYEHNFGFPLEIIPAVNPYTLHAGNEMPVIVLADGKPIANILVSAINRADPTTVISARTDVNGCVALKLDRDGFWLLNTVRMLPVNEPGVECDWESLWASLTFDLAKDTDQPAPAAESTSADKSKN